MNQSIYMPKLLKLLKKGEGIKVGLFDERSKLVIGEIVPHSLFLDHDFFLLQDLKAARQKMGRVICILFAERSSIPDIIKELKDPRYEVYFINMLNNLEDPDLERIAAADTMNLVKEICEININCICVDIGLVVLQSAFMENMTDSDICSKLAGLLSTLGIMPTIYHTKELVDTATQLSKIVIPSDHKPGRVLMIDRSIDMVAPLVYEWRYQSMIYEYMQYENGLVTLDNHKYSIFNDELFEKTKFLEINKVPEVINSFNRNKHKNRNIEKGVEQLETHLVVTNYILERCFQNSEISEVEFECLKNDFSRFEKKMESNLSKEAKIKLLLIYLHAKSCDFKPGADMLNNKYMAKFPDYLCYVDRYCQYAQQYAGKKSKIKWDTDVDVKLSLIPEIPRFVKKFVNNKNLNLNIIGNTTGINNLDIIYIKGGISYAEYRMIIELVGYKVQIVSDFIIGYKDIMNNIVCKK